MLSEFSFHRGRQGKGWHLGRGGTVLGESAWYAVVVPAQSLAHGRYSNACWIKKGLEGQRNLAVGTKPQEMGDGVGDLISWGTGSQEFDLLILNLWSLTVCCGPCGPGVDVSKGQISVVTGTSLSSLLVWQACGLNHIRISLPSLKHQVETDGEDPGNPTMPCSLMLEGVQILSHLF